MHVKVNALINKLDGITLGGKHAGRSRPPSVAGRLRSWLIEHMFER
jgi:hypothetical protein